MPRFREHAIERFIERRPDLYDPVDPPPPKRRAEKMMDYRYRRSRPVTRAEAQRIIDRPIRGGNGNTLFRAEEEENTSPGVWVVWWRTGRAEIVITYLVFGVEPDESEMDEPFEFDRPRRGGVSSAVS